VDQSCGMGATILCLSETILSIGSKILAASTSSHGKRDLDTRVNDSAYQILRQAVREKFLRCNFQNHATFSWQLSSEHRMSEVA